MTRNSVITFAFLLGLFFHLFAAGETVKLQWMGIGARSLAMGNTGVATKSLPWAPFYNPALVSARGKLTVAGGNQFLTLDRRLYFASLASEISGGAGVGITWLHSYVADVEARDIDGELNGTVNNSDDAIFFAFAKELVPLLHLGLGVEYFQRSLENLTTSTAGFGAGISYRIEEPNIDIGAAIQNLFMTLSWNSNDYYGHGQVSNEKLPLFFRIGVSYLRKMKNIPLHFCADIWKTETSPIYYGLGLEAEIFGDKSDKSDTDINTKLSDVAAEPDGGVNLPQLVLRCGFSDNRPSGGAGMYMRISRAVYIGLDYAIVAEREGLAPRHLIDLSVEY